jgi:putative ABC transport system permease protein
MISNETWRVAIDALKANKVKAALTMLGVVIGSACIVLVVTVALLGKTYVLAQIEGVGSNLVYAYLVSGIQREQRPLADEVSLADLEAVRALPRVTEAAGTHDISSSIVIGGVERPVSVIGVTEGFQEIRNLLVLQGRYFDTLDMQQRSKACLISQDLAKRFPDNMVGKDIRVGQMSFTVIGVFRERVATFGQSEITAESVIIPFPLVKYYTGKEFLRTLYSQAASADDVPRVTREVQETLENRHRAEATYLVQNLASILEAAKNISLALTAVLLVIGFIALVISGVGIMNIMLVTVTERTREIGLRKAIGARTTEILYQFLIEALIISGTGAVVGISLAVGALFIAQAFLPGDVRIPVAWWSIFISLLVSCGTGVVFGYIPAKRASRLQPTESLRYE